MREPERIEPMLALLRRVWYQNPDWRLGQLIDNAAFGSTTFYIEDDVMKERLEELAKRPGGFHSE
jgi:hypothetical protein